MMFASAMDPDEPVVLNDINLAIPAGKATALVGPTGVGKSTLVSLIPRFYDVTSGSLKVDGIDVRDLDLHELRANISMVLQDVFLFHGTIRENILFGKPDASEEEMLAAAEIANVSEFISNMPNGYDTMIGERGVKLSGGQKQLLAIGRTLALNPEILLFDEPTASLAPNTAEIVQDIVKRYVKEEKLLRVIVSHSITEAKNCR